MIVDELAHALASMTPKCADFLVRLGIPVETAWSCGVARIRTVDINLYEPDHNGFVALILPLFDGSVTTDLLAYRPGRPNQWWTRRRACTFLGQDALDRIVMDEPLRIHHNPLAWQQGGAAPNAVVVLDWPAAVREILCAPRIEADDRAHASDIQRRLASSIRLPIVEVAAHDTRRA